MNPTVKVAKQFPDIRFEHATGYKRGDNVTTYLSTTYEGRYISGFLAANVSETGVVGSFRSSATTLADDPDTEENEP